MPVYVLACKKKPKRKKTTIEDGHEETSHPSPPSPSFLELWIQAIKGPYDHVELAFVRDRQVFGYWLTNNSRFARYGDRKRARLYQNYDVTWYELKGILVEVQYQIQEKCAQLASTHARRMSWMKMMMSAFPFQQTDIVIFFIMLMDPDSELVGSSAELNDPNTSYCAAACGEVLGLEAYETFTASDLVQVCTEKCGAVEVPDPVATRRTHTIRNAAGILRADLV
jgi:hypothetical protein